MNVAQRLKNGNEHSTAILGAKDPENTMAGVSYPPQLSDSHLSSLIGDIRDWQFAHGSLLKSPPDTGAVLARPIGVSLFPSTFPRTCFENARELQVLYNELYAKVAGDEEWLEDVLRGLIKDDPLAKSLWDIHLAVKKRGYVQDISLGLFRSDYMLHVTSSAEELLSPVLKQVEFNTYSCAGGSHSNKASDMHRYLHRTGAYDSANPAIYPFSLPPSTAISSLASGLAAAHSRYSPAKSSAQTAILFVVQPNNINTCDERPLEYALWDHYPPIPAYRIEFGQDILTHTSLSPSRELLYHPPSNSSSPVEISVAYMRAGYDVGEYTPNGCEARFQLEASRAIKCPSILSHLSTFKKVQQALASPRVLEKFIDRESAARVAKTFAPLYPLDSSPLGLRARIFALNPATSSNYILKPSLEGGGHNIYGSSIPPFLKSIPQLSWDKYILMEKIIPPDQNNMLLSPQGFYFGPVVSELGIFGTCIWRRREGKDVEMLQNREAGFSFKTKRRDVDEMSVVKGFGCFDSPCLT